MNSSNMLDQLLEYSCQELQLSATSHAAAETHYRAVGEWLAAKESPLHAVAPIIYPQGSTPARCLLTVEPSSSSIPGLYPTRFRGCSPPWFRMCPAFSTTGAGRRARSLPFRETARWLA